MAYGERHSWRDTRATTSLKEAWQMRDVVMVEAVRTAVGRLGGTIKDIEADRLADALYRGYCQGTRGRLLLHCRPEEGNDYCRRLQYLPSGGRGSTVRSSRCS